MTAKWAPANRDDAIALYQSGKSVRECAAVIGVRNDTFRKWLIRESVDRRPSGGQFGLRTTIPDTLLAEYLAGVSVKALSLRYHVERSTIYRYLRDVGVEGRSRSDAMELRWRNSDACQRRAMLAAAHDASRGRVAKTDERVRIAWSKAGRIYSSNEVLLARLIAQVGGTAWLGVPLGKYNLDIVANGSVAVEVNGGTWHGYGRHLARFAERSRHILDAGYALAVVWVDKTRYPLGIRCAQHLITLAELTSRDPTSARQYWVIRGDGKIVSACEDDGKDVALIMPSGRRRHARP